MAYSTAFVILKNVEYFNYLGSMITNDARCTREIKCRIDMAKAEFNKKKTLFISKLDLNLRKKVLHLEYSLVWCGNVDTSESRSEVSGKF
jgi:hypothetical protein